MKLVYLAISLLLASSVNAKQIEVTGGSPVHMLQTEGFHSYNFGSVWVNSRAIANFNLKNTGTTSLIFKEAYIYGGDFSANHSCTRGLQPNEVCTFSISFWPMFEGMASGRFVLSFFEEDVVFDLWGQAQRM